MAKRTKELQTIWWDWLSTAERLLSSLHRQTVALTLRRVEQVEEIQPELDSLAEHMRKLDDRAVALAAKLAGELGVEPNLRSLVSALETAEAQAVQALANRVIVVGRNVQAVVNKNQALIENELEYIHGTAAIMMQEAQSQAAVKPYSGAKTGNIALDSAA